MKPQKPAKTNAMRMLDTLGVAYACRTYACERFEDGGQIADLLGLDHALVYKTLVTAAAGNRYHVFVLPIDSELDLKKAARAAGEKALAMVHVKDIERVTGYVRGGCTAIGMKKQYPVLIDRSAERLPVMIVSGGRLGVQLELAPGELLRAAQARYADVTVSGEPHDKLNK